jgi:predicted O-methyltransferase YrrM
VRICRDCDTEVEVSGGRFVAHGDCPGWFAQVDDETGWRDHLESRFTLPRPDCPYPERWHSDDADSTEHEVAALVAAFARALRPDVVVETGSAWGQTAEAIGQVLDDAGVGRLFTIEPDEARAEATGKRCKPLHSVTVVTAKSLDWEPANSIGNARIGFAWLDSLPHLRVPEFLHLRAHMAPGAFVGFHDTAPHQGPLRQQIEALETQGLLLPVHLPTPRGVTFAEVC